MADYSDLVSVMSGSRRSSPYDRKRQMALQMLQSGADYSPIQHPLQGAARLAQALVGGWMANKADSEEKDAREQLSQKIADAGKIVDPQERIAAYTAIDPQIGMRAGSQFAVEQAKIKAQNERLGAAADGFGSSYGLPPQGGQIQRAPLPAPGQDPAANAIAGIESGGRYDAVGPVANKQGNRAYGKYQVLDTNIGPWTQEVLGRPMTPQEFLANPQAQDAVFKAKFGQYQQQYGPEGAARAWFAGEGGMNNPNAADVNGMTVQRYGQKFAQAMPPQPGQAPPAPPVTVQATPPGQPQPLTVNMRGPGGIPQGSADGAPPPPQAPGGMPAVMAQAPAIPDVPRPQPTPQQIRRAQDLILSGTPRAQAEATMNAEIDRDWSVQRERAKMEYERQFGEYKSGRERADKQPQQQFDNSNKLRDEFNASPAVKSYRTVVPMLESAKDATTRPTRAADLNLVYAFAKLMDPDSVVRESETGAVVATQSVMDRIGSYVGQLNGQAMLNPDARAKLIAELESRFKSLESSYKTLEDHYGGMAARFGVRREDVIVPIRKPAGGTTATSPEDLKKLYGLE
jgi:hypothetical protein